MRGHLFQLPLFGLLVLCGLATLLVELLGGELPSLK